MGIVNISTNDFYLGIKKRSKGYLAFITIILFTHGLCAQTTSKDSIRELNTKNSKDSSSLVPLTKFPLATTDFIYYPESNFNSKSGKVNIGTNEYNFTFQYAIPLQDKKIYFYNKIDLSVFSYDVYQESTDLLFQETYRSLDFTVGLIKVLPRKWRLAINFSPTLASDFKDKLSSDDFIYQFSALAVKRAKDNLQYGLGIAYTSRFGKLTLLPLVNLTYKKNKWLTSVLIPTYISQFYCFNENSRIGLSANVNGDYYNVSFDAIPTTIDLNKASYSRITIGPEYTLWRLVFGYRNRNFSKKYFGDSK